MVPLSTLRAGFRLVLHGLATKSQHALLGRYKREQAMRRALTSYVITRYNKSMKLSIRRIGNSLGVIVPRSTLKAWGVGADGYLELTNQAIRPPGRSGFSHDELDELKRSIAFTVVRDFTPRQIRAQILANLYRWKSQGMWVSAYDEWRHLAEQDDDGALFAAMLGRDENSARLRQSMPFVGLLSQNEVRKLHEEAAA